MTPSVEAVDLGAALPLDDGRADRGRRRPAAAPQVGIAPGCQRPSPRRRLAEIQLDAPVGRVGKIVAIGRNYREHAARGGRRARRPTRSSSPSSRARIVGPEAGHRWRASDTGQVDYEAELAVVIGRRGRDVSGRATPSSTCSATPACNDVSARDLQFGDGQWVRGKSLDTFCPIGPWLVTSRRDPGSAGPPHPAAWSTASVLQEASTGEMVHGVADLIAFCSGS